MAAKFVPISGPIVGTSVYVNNAIVARDVAITLPEITPAMVDVQATGALSLPVWQLIENMESSITKIGVDLGLRSMLKPEPLNYEIRWVQTVTDANSVTKNVGCKAFLRLIPAVIPGIGLTVGETAENECTGTVVRYQLYVDGAEMWLIDKLTGQVRIGGTDYGAGVGSLL